MAKYLVTGGCGFIGSHLVELLLSRGHSVSVIDDLSTGKLSNIPDGVPVTIGDVADPNLIAQAMEGHDGCFHLAAVASVEKSREQWLETNHANLVGSIAVFDAARRVGGGRRVPVIYASSAAVYGNNANIPLEESAERRPLSAYGADKLACELHAVVADHVHGVPTVGFRFFNVYGPRQDPKSPYSGVISIFADRISRGEPIMIFGDGEQVRDFVNVGDVVRVLVAAMEAPPPGSPVFNVCTGRGTSIKQLAAILGDLTGRNPQIGYAPARPGDIARSIGSPAALIAAFGLPCSTILAEGLNIS
ncbi:Epimerase [Azospirillaceae bacterium]